MDCPRCDGARAVKFFEAPKNGVWELYQCPDCSFVWRSTEEEAVRNKDLYNRDFKLNKNDMEKMIDKPAIPPLRRK